MIKIYKKYLKNSKNYELDLKCLKMFTYKKKYNIYYETSIIEKRWYFSKTFRF